MLPTSVWVFWSEFKCRAGMFYSNTCTGMSPVALIFTPVTNLLLYGWIVSLQASSPIAKKNHQACSAGTDPYRFPWSVLQKLVRYFRMTQKSQKGDLEDKKIQNISKGAWLYTPLEGTCCLGNQSPFMPDPLLSCYRYVAYSPYW